MSNFNEIESIVRFDQILSSAFQDVVGVSFDPMENELEFIQRLELPNTYTINMGLDNDQYKSLVVINFDEKFLYNFVDEGDLEMGFDALGEVLNTIGGYFAGKPDIVEKYGELVQAPPMKLETKVIFPSTDSVRGCLKVNGMELHFGYLIQSTISPFLQRILDKKRKAGLIP